MLFEMNQISGNALCGGDSLLINVRWIKTPPCREKCNLIRIRMLHLASNERRVTSLAIPVTFHAHLCFG